MMGPNLVTQVDHLLKCVLLHARLRLTFAVTLQSPGSGLHVTFTGADVPHLLARNAELLLALEHVATQAIRLDPSQHELVSFDAGGFKDQRDRAISRLAQQGLAAVKSTGASYAFRPMNSRERRLLHLALAASGLVTQSEGDGPLRHLVLHPKSGPSR